MGQVASFLQLVTQAPRLTPCSYAIWNLTSKFAVETEECMGEAHLFLMTSALK